MAGALLGVTLLGCVGGISQDNAVPKSLASVCCQVSSISNMSILLPASFMSGVWCGQGLVL